MKPLILLVILSFLNLCNCQNTILKYIGKNKDKMHFSYNYVEFNQDFISLSNEDRELNLNCDKSQVVSSNDITRIVKIFIECNETIEYYIDKEGMIHYSCKNNPYRKTESEFINTCYEKYGAALPFNEKKMFKEIFIKYNKSGYNEETYIKENELLESWFKRNLVSESFYKYFKALYWSLSVYNKLEKKSSIKELSEKIEMSFNDSDYLMNIPEYRKAILLYCEILMNEKKIENKLSERIDFIIDNFNEQKIIDYLLFFEIKTKVNDSKNESLISSSSITKFKNNCKNQYFLEEIENDLNPFSEQTRLLNIISKYKGKLVLVDFWASWCIPCVEEFPSEKKLMQKYPNVAFVFLSIDKSNTAWQKAMAKHNDILNKENSFLLVKSDKDELLKEINLSTIPRFVLFGKDGKIINIDAPRPSSKEIEILIEKHL